MIGVPSDARIADEIRRLSARLISGSGSIRSVLVAGPMGGEGATTIATLLALALAAKEGTSVLLVDANLRTCRMHELLGLAARPGLSDCSTDQPPPYQQVTGPGRLAFLGAGSVASDPGARTGLDCVAALPALARRVRDEFTHIVWDAAPALQHTDVVTLAPLVDAVIVVAEVDHTRLDHLSLVREQLQGVNANLLGVVMNRGERYWPLRWRWKW